MPLRAPDGTSVSIITLWIQNLGIWRGANGRGVHWLAAINIICYIITSTSQIIALIRAQNDREKLFECVSVIPFCGMGFLKLLSLILQQDRWRSLISTISDLELQQTYLAASTDVDYESDDGENGMKTCKNHVEKYTKKYRSIATLLLRSYIFTAVVYIITPFIEYAIKKFQGIVLLNYPHILPGWAPLDEISFLGYVATVVCEGVAAAYCVCAHIIFDVSVVGVMIFIHAQFLLLHDYCEDIGGRGLICNLSRKRDLRALYRISKCHRLHVSIIKLVNELSNLTQNILGIYFAVATLTLCSVAVQLNTDEISTTQLLSLVQYLSCTLIQLILFCKYGDAVINESSVGFGEGPFASAWWCLSPRVRRQLALLCVGMTRRCYMFAGPFQSLNLPTFIQVVRTAYSYYAVIRKK